MLSDLLAEIEDRFRQVIREEIQMALSEMKNPTQPKPESKEKSAIQTNTDFPELLTAPQVAELLGVKAARIYDLTRERTRFDFPVIVIGERSYRYSKQAILKWTERNSS